MYTTNCRYQITTKCTYCNANRTSNYNQPCVPFMFFRDVWKVPRIRGIELSKIVVVCFLVEFGSKGETRCTRLAIVETLRNTFPRVKYVRRFYALLAFVSGRCFNVKRATGARCFRGIIRLKKTLTRLWNDPRLLPPFPPPSLQFALARVRFYGQPLVDFPEKRTNVLVLQRKSNCLFPLTSLHFTRLQHILDNCAIRYFFRLE